MSILGKKLIPVINVKPDLILPWVKTSEIYIDITSRYELHLAGQLVAGLGVRGVV